MEVSKITALVGGEEKELIVVHLPTEKDVEKHMHIKWGDFYSIENVKVEHLSCMTNVYVTESALRKEVDERVTLRIKSQYE